MEFKSKLGLNSGLYYYNGATSKKCKSWLQLSGFQLENFNVKYLSAEQDMHPSTALEIFNTFILWPLVVLMISSILSPRPGHD